MTGRSLTRVPLRSDDADVLVVGAGVAGLAATRRLEEAGLTVELLEAEVTAGGRIGSEIVDGFTVDHGLQWLNPAGPELAAHVDLDALGLESFLPGVELLVASGPEVSDVRRVTNPRRAPQHLLSTLRSGLAADAADVREVWALRRWWSGHDQPTGSPDATWLDALDAGGLEGRPRIAAERLLEAVTLENTRDSRIRERASAAEVARRRLADLARGSFALPAAGMVTLPVVMAGALQRPVRTEWPVDSLVRRGGAWEVRGPAGVLRAPAVLLATPADAASDLLHGSGSTAALLPHLGWHGATTWWFTADEAPTDSTALRVDVRPHRGPVVVSAVVSNVAPEYSESGRPLVAATVLWRSGHPEGEEAAVRVHLSELWDTPAFGWELVARQDIPHGMPALPPTAERVPTRLDHGLYTAGDHSAAARAGGIEGALTAGARAAEVILTAHRSGA
ncbi:Phytoene dehydrogenase-related protein [Kytococcus aerolatus]|uniref:Phytoene dehydrogenase-related protein n=1 Tax=Kytococcus aerolatus TaxID=592308 RepID=A0A212TC33_9MICO|nr:FAD-dependent oxidoreductase [Kytococcus aerolatus]SNC63582.1 Phytoene dehydrogenase-related protein [Kytococcus aerolatus]